MDINKVPEDGGFENVAKKDQVTLVQAGINHHDSPKFRRLARDPLGIFLIWN